jgi:alpha-galactosidase
LIEAEAIFGEMTLAQFHFALVLFAHCRIDQVHQHLLKMQPAADTNERVIYYPHENAFVLNTERSSYAFRVDTEGYLNHLYWGDRIDVGEDLSYLAKDSVIVSFDAGSKNSKLMEYADFGTGDFRIPSFRVVYADDGSGVSPLEYHSHDIVEGIPSTFDVQDYPHFRSDPNRTTTLLVTLKDRLKGLSVILRYTVFQEYDAITRSVAFENHGDATVWLEEVNSLTVDFPPAVADQPYMLNHFSGAWGRERHLNSKPVSHGIVGVESRRGISSHQHNPFLILSEGALAEDHGVHYGFGLLYSGSFHAKVEQTQSNTARLVLGLHPDTFRWELLPRASFRTPEAVSIYSSSGAGQLSRQLHDFIRNRLVPTQQTPARRPVLVNSWEAMYFNCSEQSILERLVDPGQELGLDLVVLDDGWFLNRDNDTRSLGDWQVDLRKFPNGLDGLAKKINAKGMQFGIWMEPEMVSRQSLLYRAHPEWCLHAPQRAKTEGRNQLVLDLSLNEVQDFIIKSVSDVLKSANITYLKWDFNRALTEVDSIGVSSARQGEVSHRCIMGLQKVLGELSASFPNVLFETCSSGGGRFDLAMLYFSPQIWTSDNTDAFSRTFIQYGTSFGYPLSSMGAHVSKIPNEQVRRNSPIETRQIVASSGVLGYELDLLILSEKDKSFVRNEIQFYKQHIEPLVLMGDMYRLLSPFNLALGNDVPRFAAWMLVSKDRSEAAVWVVRISPYEVIFRPSRLRLKGLDPEANYLVDCKGRLEQHGFRKNGRTLMNAGFVLPHATMDDQDAIIIVLQKV